MITPSLGNALAPYTDPPNDVYSRGQSNTVYMPDEGYRVYRSPTVNDYQNEPGSRWHGQPIKRFTHNGYELTPVSLGEAAAPAPLTFHLVKSIGPTLAAAVGAGFGVYLASAERRPTGALVGALVGGVLGIVFGR